MQKYIWRTDDRGAVLVTKPGLSEAPLVLDVKMAAGMDKVIAQWEPLALKHGARTGVSAGWILSMIWRESLGNPNAQNPEKASDPTDDGVGLMQLTIKYFAHGRTVAQLKDPDTNIGIGTDYIASIKTSQGNNFPRVSAIFNAGSVRASDLNPFGMVSTGNHIEAEVAALDYYLTRSDPHPDPHVVPDEQLLSEADRAWVLAHLVVDEEPGARDFEHDGSDPLN